MIRKTHKAEISRRVHTASAASCRALRNRPRLAVFRSRGRTFYAQIIDDAAAGRWRGFVGG